jgi:Zn-dependent protease with chaperone function
MLRPILLFAILTVVLSAAQSQGPPPAPQDRHVKTYTLPPDKLEKAIEYSRASNRLHFISVGYGILVLGALLAWRVAPKFRDWAESLTRRRILQAYVFAPLILLTIDVLEMPISIYSHHLSLKFEQSIQSWGSWLLDWTKGDLISFVVAGFIVWLLYAVIRRSPRRWWFYFWLASIPIVIFGMFITPVLIEPLFFQFAPLATTQPALVGEISKVVARGGLEIPADRMFEMKASEKLKSLNAYVTGIGASKRVVVWDNTIQKMSPGEILFVFGHEMGHYVLHHIWLGIGMACLVILVFLFAGYHFMRWAIARWGSEWSIRGVDDWASLPVLLIAAAIFSFLSEPITNSFSRVLEHNADIYGLEVIHGLVPDSPQAAARSFQILGEVSLDDPNPSEFIKLWLYDHPSISDRVQFSADYDPWDKGQPPKYVK